MGAKGIGFVLCAAAMAAMGPLTAHAADIPFRHHRHHGYRWTEGRDYILHRSFRWVRRSGPETERLRAYAACPTREPVDYRPRLIGDADCQAARPEGLSGRLYNPLVEPHWGTEY